ncbi:MAG: DUF362 domain-containing protein [Clostridia bacterium]|nr:DUF362 domain-containing protein [Clostridia bacterium]
MSRVYMNPCTTYELDTVYEKTAEILNGLGGMGSFVKPGMRVALKPNMILVKKPAEAATTHPAVVSAIARLVREAGGIPYIVESPFGQYTVPALERHYVSCGMKQLQEEGLVELNTDLSTAEIELPEGLKLKKLGILKPIADADLVISLSKLKTHALMTYTGAVKNLFGVIAGLQKGSFHMRFPDSVTFADALIDICLAVKPGLHIMDAIVGMEGDGPTAGTPRDIGFIGASTDPFALDLAAASTICEKVKIVPTIQRARARGLGPAELNEIEFPMATPDQFYIPDYKFAKTESSTTVSWLRNSKLLKPYPAFDKKICVGCGECFRACPVQALQMVEKRPVLDIDKCIRCFCCHEGCSPQAVRIKRNRFAGMVEAGLSFVSFLTSELPFKKRKKIS